MTRGEIAFAVISGLLVNEVTDICPWLAIRLVRWAARLRYPHAPERAATRGEEFAALINERPGKLFKLFTAVGFALHAVVALNGWRAAAKRTVDVGVAAVALAVTLPLWLAAAVAIRLTSRGPVFFQQERVTKGGASSECTSFVPCAPPARHHAVLQARPRPSDDAGRAPAAQVELGRAAPALERPPG